jgi:hypothetical protein
MPALAAGLMLEVEIVQERRAGCEGTLERF